MKAVSTLAAALFAAIFLLIVSPTASATFPGENGWIVFRKVFTSDYHPPDQLDYNHAALFLIRPDGTGLRRLTHPPEGVVHTQPDWSPNGRWIAFQRQREGGHPTKIIRIRRNGTDRQVLSRACDPELITCESNPGWSPDGQRIAFTRWGGEAGPKLHINLFVMRANGTHRVRVTQGTVSRHEDYAPQWSPSGRRLAFERFSASRQKSALFTVRVNGRGLRRLTPWRMSGGGLPDWSPNGRWILFFNHIEIDRPKTLWLVHPSGEGLHRITSSEGGTYGWWSAGFSPNGQRITAGRAEWAVGGANADTFVIKKTGEIVLNLTQSVRWDSEPDWGPRP